MPRPVKPRYPIKGWSFLETAPYGSAAKLPMKPTDRLEVDIRNQPATYWTRRNVLLRVPTRSADFAGRFHLLDRTLSPS
jgi:hypothetical protein